MRYERHHPHLQKHTDSLYPQSADGDEKKERENDRKLMTVLIYSVIKSSANGVSINSATNAVETTKIYENDI